MPQFGVSEKVYFGVGWGICFELELGITGVSTDTVIYLPNDPGGFRAGGADVSSRRPHMASERTLSCLTFKVDEQNNKCSYFVSVRQYGNPRG